MLTVCVQIVNLEFEDGSMASFTMIAFTEKLCVRTTRVFGSRGELFCDDGATVKHFDFASRSTKIYAEENEDDEDFKVDPSAPRGGGHQGMRTGSNRPSKFTSQFPDCNTAKLKEVPHSTVAGHEILSIRYTIFHSFQSEV